VKDCGPCPVFASFTLAFALLLRKKHAKTSVRVRKTSVRVRKTSVRVRIISVKCRKCLDCLMTCGLFKKDSAVFR
jgi:hypothetical protein